MRSSALVLALFAPSASSLLPGGPKFVRRSAAPAVARQPQIHSIAVDVAAAENSRPNSRQQKGRLNVRIDDVWYDLTGWRAAHPAGTHWIDAYNNSDATEVMWGFHSDAAMGMLKRLPQSKNHPELPPPSQATYNFRKLRKQLVADGWYRPNFIGEAKKLLPWAACLAAGVHFARLGRSLSAPLQTLLGVLFLGTSNTLAGWLSHDYVHGRGVWPTLMRPFGELIGGMSTTWWSNKHNMHHALTNEVGYDEDIALDPFLHLWQPDPKNDLNKYRKYQHIYWPLPYSILFLYWRYDSIRYVLQAKKWGEAARLAIHWAMFSAIVPFGTLMLAIWFSGLLTATIVTVTHQSEEMFYGENLRKYDFVEAQFRSTRNAKCNNPISHMLWGGMQWQLEHHIFPTMPRYKYPAVSKVLQKFAEENNIDYRISGEFAIIAENVALLKKIGEAEAVVGNPTSEPIFKQV